mmetsp:Transcript_2592/g.5876  ORF Transcript_2592/g.5876 Transcript_2592/m.5876 type:complete len:97 (-) Transcript_2592:2770-3060(-)|eukprot:CAMPEP_0204902786 /NCGR_PEP_ID=MMETSP1397-20131031/3872_1 /ASSEMBLY_ACC=CAM_ASM_000891 /TAXON_ID=49980 /ORGANISM="Climacostomum Climacostomum virens, Strain Stock W-24" /LENGTH=96 /DNA_ID=CAMNT_0052071337 /DNA_START=987 /DNA_END=1277 /DNA_ORIENTATION=-
MATHLSDEDKVRVAEQLVKFYDNGNQAELDPVFELFDRNHDHFIDKEELQVVMGDITGIPLNENEIADMFREADTDANGKIDKAEFIRVMGLHKSG